MQRLPNEYWLKYMLLFSGLNQSEIQDSADLLGVIKPTKEYLSFLNKRLKETKPKPFGYQYKAARPWIRRQKVVSLARQDDDAVAARDLLSNTRVRPVIEPLILAGMKHAEISYYTKEITGQLIPEGVLELYQHYFWNRDLLTIDQWFSIFRQHPRGVDLRACFNQGPEFALWKVGYRVDIPQEEVIKSMFHESAMRFMETNEMKNDRNTAMTAKLWAENVFKASEILNRSGDGVREILTELRQLSIQLGRREITSLEDLDKVKAELEANIPGSTE